MPVGTLGGPVPTGRMTELRPGPGETQPEYAMTEEVQALYRSALDALATLSFRRALPLLREARARTFRQMKAGPLPLRLAFRQFTRIGHVEEQVADYVLIEDRLKMERDVGERKELLQQVQATLLRDLAWAYRGLYGQPATALLDHAQRLLSRSAGSSPEARAHQLALAASLAADHGHEAQARELFASIPAPQLASELFDLAAVGCYVALGDQQQALARLRRAAERESWVRSTPQGETGQRRRQAYRLPTLDPLRGHPLFVALVTEAEEAHLVPIQPTLERATSPVGATADPKTGPKSAAPVEPSQTAPPAPGPHAPPQPSRPAGPRESLGPATRDRQD